MTTIRNARTGQPVGAPASAPKPAGKPARMTLGNVQEKAAPAPLRDIIYGVDGVGKTSFAADAPAPIFLPGRDWPRRLAVARFPQPSCWQDVLDAIEELRTQKHAFASFVLDAVDLIEPLIWTDVCLKSDDGKGGRPKNIEAVGGGFKKGYQVALDWWRLLTERLTLLQHQRGMHVLLVLHAKAVNFKNPQGEDYLRWTLNIHQDAGEVLKQWADNVLFMSFDRRTAKASKYAKAKGQGGQLRMIYTQWHAAYDAKNRANLPPIIDMDFPSYFGAVMEGTDLDGVRQEIADGIARLSARPIPFGKTTLGAAGAQMLTLAGDDPVKLHKLASWIAGKLETLPETEEEPATQGGGPEDATPAGGELTDAEVEALPETEDGIADLIAEDPAPDTAATIEQVLEEGLVQPFVGDAGATEDDLGPEPEPAPPPPAPKAPTPEPAKPAPKPATGKPAVKVGRA